MQAFHFDFNTAHFQQDYIKKRLDFLRSQGYDTILWEIEDAVKFSSCPEIADEDAFSMDEWLEILNYGSLKGFKHIPLFQCAGHAEYVLRHQQYRHLAENDSGYCYCLSSQKLWEFLKKILFEIRIMFPDAEYFHIGCDETRMLGTCPLCASEIDRIGTGGFLLNHIVKVQDYLKELGVKTAIWADLPVNHPEILENLPKDILLFDWHYDLYDECRFAYIPGSRPGVTTNLAGEIPKDIPEKYLPYLFPADSKLPNPFFYSHYLADKNIPVAVCSSTSCSGENDFCGNAMLRIKNVFDAAKAGVKNAGTLVTSWTQHLFPYELQNPAISAAIAGVSNKFNSAEEFLASYGKEQFNLEIAGNLFPQVIKDLSNNCLFADTKGMGHSKFRRVPRSDHYTAVIKRMDNDTLDKYIIQANNALAAFYRAERNLEIIRSKASFGIEELELWILAAKNLQLRARFALLMLYREGYREQVFTEKIIKDFEVVRNETAQIYKGRVTSRCMNRFLYILFDLPIKTLQSLEENKVIPL